MDTDLGRPTEDARSVLHHLNNAVAALRLQAAVTRGAAEGTSLRGDLERIEASAAQVAAASRRLGELLLGTPAGPGAGEAGSEKAPSQDAAPPRGPSPVVLVVDDDAVIRALISRLLTGAGYQVKAVELAEEAESWLAAGRPADLLVCDVELPGRDGHWLVDRASDLRPALPVIILSGLGEQAAHGGVRVLPKPFEPARLLAAVAEVAGEQ